MHKARGCAGNRIVFGTASLVFISLFRKESGAYRLCESKHKKV